MNANAAEVSHCLCIKFKMAALLELIADLKLDSYLNIAVRGPYIDWLSKAPKNFRGVRQKYLNSFTVRTDWMLNMH